eukprot:5934960-Prymnesium_polylepis.1
MSSIPRNLLIPAVLLAIGWVLLAGILCWTTVQRGAKRRADDVEAYRYEEERAKVLHTQMLARAVSARARAQAPVKRPKRVHIAHACKRCS